VSDMIIKLPDGNLGSKQRADCGAGVSQIRGG
jgi:hypothetical protein